MFIYICDEDDDDNADNDVDAKEEEVEEDVEETERMRVIDRVQLLQSRLPFFCVNRFRVLYIRFVASTCVHAIN